MFELFNVDLLFLLLVGVVVSAHRLLPWLRWRLHSSSAVDPRLRGIVRAHKLRSSRSILGDVAEGTLDGFPIHVRYIDTQRHQPEEQSRHSARATCRVTISLPSPLPAGMRLSSMSVTQTVLQGLGAQDIEIGDHWIDPALRIRAEQPTLAQQLLTMPEVITALRRAVTHTADALRVTPTEVQLTRSGINVPDAGAVLDIAMELTQALCASADGFWQGVADEQGLSEVQISRRGTILSGVLSGVPITAQFTTDEDGECVTRIKAILDPPLPGGLRLRERHPERAAPSTGNPILDMKVEMTTTDLSGARRLLAAPTLTGPLMELLDAPGETRILPESVRLSLQGWPLTDLQALLALTAEVAEHLTKRDRAPGAARSRQPTT